MCEDDRLVKRQDSRVKPAVCWVSTSSVATFGLEAALLLGRPSCRQQTFPQLDHSDEPVSQ